MLGRHHAKNSAILPCPSGGGFGERIGLTILLVHRSHDPDRSSVGSGSFPAAFGRASSRTIASTCGSELDRHASAGDIPCAGPRCEATGCSGLVGPVPPTRFGCKAGTFARGIALPVFSTGCG